MANVALDSLTDTWNAGGTTFRAIKMNVTDTASASGSLLMDLQVGGNSKANISKAGLLTLASGITLTGANTLQTSTGNLTIGTAAGNGNVVMSPHGTGNFGINTTGPDRKLDVLDGGGSAQFRTTYTDGSVYTDYQTLSDGSTLILDSAGRRVNSSVVNNTSVLSRPMRGGLAFDGFTSTQGVSEPCGSVTTTDFTLDAIFLTPTSSSATYPVIQLKPSNSKTTEVTSLVVSIVSGSLVVQIIGPGATTDWRKATLTSFVTNYGGKVVHVAVTRTGTTFALYVNGVAQTVSETTNGTDPTWAGSVVSSFVWVGSQDTNYFNSTVYAYRVHTRVLSASEVVTLANNGVQEADKWASLTALYTSSFTSGTDSWAVTGASAVTRDAGPTGGQTDNLKIATTVANNAFASTRTMATSMVAGKRYRLTYSYYMDVAGNAAAKYFGVWGGAGAQNLEHVTPVDKVWTTRTIEFTSNATTALFSFYLETVPGTTTFNSTNTTDAVYLRGITVTPIGCLLDPDLAIGVGYQAPDRSSNHYDGLISATGVSHVLEQRRGQARFSLSADGYMGDTTSRVCIPSNARIESITAYSTGTPTFTIGDDSGAAANVVASVTLSASTKTDFTLLKRFLTTGTAGRCYVDFTAGAAATTFTITYSTVADY
jgi:hypothetical protein